MPELEKKIIDVSYFIFSLVLRYLLELGQDLCVPLDVVALILKQEEMRESLK